jgi:hypothetical protein
MPKYGLHPTTFLDSQQRRIFTNTRPRRYVCYTGIDTETAFEVEPVNRACYYQSFDNQIIVPIDENFNIVKIPKQLRG